MAPGAAIRSACVIAVLAACLGGCQPAPPPEKPESAPALTATAATPKATPPAPVAAAPQSPTVEAPKPAPKPKAKAKKRAPKPKPAPEAVKPAPPPPPPPQPNPEEERARKRDAYLAALAKATIAFNPPSPVPLAQRASVALSVTPTPETAQLADDLRKSLDSGVVWSPRLRARLSGTDFEIAPAEGKDFDGAKDLSGHTDWGWGVVPKAAGTKTLVATLSVALPPGLGGPRDLPSLQRSVEVEATLAWRAERLWSEYWQWIAAALVLVLAIVWWARRR